MQSAQLTVWEEVGRAVDADGKDSVFFFLSLPAGSLWSPPSSRDVSRKTRCGICKEKDLGMYKQEPEEVPGTSAYHMAWIPSEKP